MKVIKYNLRTIEESTEFLAQVTLPWSEANEEIAKIEAHNGEYTVVDDGQPEPVAEPTAEERLEALESAMLELLGVNTNG